MFVSHDTAVRQALEIVTRDRCKAGQHFGCQHRPIPEWVRRAQTRTLPAADRTGRILTVRS